jgi:hypothetical protein
MMRLAALLLAVCASGLGYSPRLSVVIDASSPAEYNRWVWQHSVECPDFRHVYITCDSWQHRGNSVRPAISFWTDSGPLLMHLILPESQGAPSPVAQMGPLIDIFANSGQLTVASGGLDFVTYDRFGRRLFEDSHRPEGLTSGRWTRFSLNPPGTVLLDDSGKVLSTVSSSGTAGILYGGDSICALNADGAVVLIDRAGRVLWRSRKVSARCVVAAAPYGGPVAAATGDSLMIWIPPSTKTVVRPHDREWQHFGRPTMTWSRDGQFLAIYQGSKTSWDSGRVFAVNREGRLVRPVRKTRLYNVSALLWLGDTLVLPALNVDVSHTQSRFRSTVTADSYVISFLPPRGDVSRGVIHGRFYLYGTWTGSGRHLAYTTYRKYLIAEWIP